MMSVRQVAENYRYAVLELRQLRQQREALTRRLGARHRERVESGREGAELMDSTDCELECVIQRLRQTESWLDSIERRFDGMLQAEPCLRTRVIARYYYRDGRSDGEIAAEALLSACTVGRIRRRFLRDREEEERRRGAADRE